MGDTTQTPTDTKTTRRGNATQRKIAQGCAMTVVTESAAVIHHDGVIAQVLDQKCRYGGKYDLLSVPNLKHLLKDRSYVTLLGNDILTAVSLHQVETVLIASMTVKPREVVERLREACPPFRGGKSPRFETLKLPKLKRPEASKTLVVTCMDWRLHGPDGFARAMNSAFDVDRFAVMATVGGAKELYGGTVRARMAHSQIAQYVDEGFKRVIVLSHTDCGKYGGDKAFDGADDQRARLSQDLGASAAAIAAAFRGVTVETGIVRCRTDGVDSVAVVKRSA